MSSSSTARVLSNSSSRSSRRPSNRKYRGNQSHNQKDSLVSGNRRRGQARNESQDAPGNLPVRYLRELPRCEAENQISATTTDGDKLPAAANSCGFIDSSVDTPCRAPLPDGKTASVSCDQYFPDMVQEHTSRLDFGEHDLASSTDEQICSGEYPSFMSKRPLYNTRKMLTDRPRRSMVLPHQKGLQIVSLGESARRDRVIRST